MISAEKMIETKKISKNFGGVQALFNVDLTLHQQEVLGLVGDNGAGKSTLIKILSGALLPSEGKIIVHNKREVFRSPRDARSVGICAVYQDLALCDNIDACTNIFLGVETKRTFLKWLGFVDKRKMREASGQLLKDLNIQLKSPTKPVKYLSGGQRQAVAIAKAFASAKPRVLILDEPTAGLAAGGAVKRLRKLIKDLAEMGTSIIIISHDLEDIFAVTDRIAVLRHGELVTIKKTSETTRKKIISHMITAVSIDDNTQSEVRA